MFGTTQPTRVKKNINFEVGMSITYDHMGEYQNPGITLQCSHGSPSYEIT